MQEHHVHNEGWTMSKRDLILRTEFRRNAILPLLDFVIKLSYRIQKLAVGLLARFHRIELHVALAFNHRKLSHNAEKIHRAFLLRQLDCTHSVGRVFVRKIKAAVVIVDARWSSRPKRCIFVQHVQDPEKSSTLLGFEGSEPKGVAPAMQSNACCYPHSCGNEEKGRLWIRSPL